MLSPKIPPVLLILLLSIRFAEGEETDWPQWRGPERTGVSREKGLLKKWPRSGPPKAWSITGIGEGYGTVSVKGDRIYVQGTEDSESLLFCLSRANGEVLWKKPLGRRLDQDRGPGPRGTPTVDGDRIYAMNEEGALSCLKAEDGAVVWRRDILADFGGQNPGWHISESPLVDGDRVIITPGGPDACIAALNKENGETVWASKGLDDPASYSSLIVAVVDGLRTYTTLTAQAGVGVRASDGHPLWRYEAPANGTANCATPVFLNNKVFYTSAYGQGCGLLKLEREGDEITTSEIYFNKTMQNHHGGVVLIRGYLYGFSGEVLTCMDFTTGKERWKNRSVGKGSITAAEGRLYLLGENNVVGLAEATPTGYTELGRFRIEDRGWPSWSHPVVSGKRLYIRNWDALECFDISEK